MSEMINSSFLALQGHTQRSYYSCSTIWTEHTQIYTQK